MNTAIHVTTVKKHDTLLIINGANKQNNHSSINIIIFVHPNLLGNYYIKRLK